MNATSEISRTPSPSDSLPHDPAPALTLAEPFVFEAMGTVVSVRAVGGVPAAALPHLRDAFEALEDRFSLYRPASEASQVANRTLTLRQASDEYRRVYDLAIDWRAATSGAFTPHRPDGAVDLSGIVKALGIQAAAAVLDAHGVHDYVLNAGGDVVVSGAQPDGRPWVVGIVDPDDRTRLLSQYSAPVPVSDAGGEPTSAPTRRAVATSGVAERGDHVWHLGSDDTFCQVTVVADDIVTADVLATAVLAGGPGTLAEATTGWPGLEVLACAPDGRRWATPAFRA